MNEKVKSRVQAVQMGFLQRINDLTLLDKVKSADICESLNIISLLLCQERLQLCWYLRSTGALAGDATFCPGPALAEGFIKVGQGRG